MTRILIASPVKQKERILLEFLKSLKALDQTNLEIHYVFIDDENEHDLLLQFAHENNDSKVLSGDAASTYVCDESTHHWREELIWKVARYKDQCIALCLEEGFDFLFLVDSDLYLHPKTLTHLVSQQKDIISEVFWTQWTPELIPMPQVWMGDQYRLYPSARGENLTDDEITRRTTEFLQMLKQPGTYKVGGLGACTLIHRRALEKGLSFKEIHNVSFIGEDRHFCLRAAALGLELFADTHYPPFHIYRESELDSLEDYIRDLSPSPSTITLAMLVRNEADRYLAQVLEQATQYIDQAVILDDASEDDTVKLCTEVLKDIPLTLVSNSNPGFHNEVELRKQLWQMAVNTGSDWIVILDADELLEEEGPRILRELANNKTMTDYYAFRLYDMWTEKHYREDPFWQAHMIYRPFMVRNISNLQAIWQETQQHCGRFPLNITKMQGTAHPLRIKHLGWMRPKDRLQKYYRYQQLDPQGLFGIPEQYESILDPNPNLILWDIESK